MVYYAVLFGMIPWVGWALHERLLNSKKEFRAMGRERLGRIVHIIFIVVMQGAWLWIVVSCLHTVRHLDEQSSCQESKK